MSGCSGGALSGGENEDDVIRWACLNSVGWLRGSPADRVHYAGEATDMWLHADRGEADGEDWSTSLQVSQDLVGWYDSGNEDAVRAFVDVNECFEKTG